MSDATASGSAPDDERLADRVADLADRIRRGEEPDIGPAHAARPAESDALRRLLPAIRLLSELADDEPPDLRPAWMGRPADVLGDFRLEREIGRGGLGVVYEARQVSLGRRVAVKVLAPSSRLDARQRRRFAIEAQATAALQHPNIVPVIACGDEGGVPYLAMRLVEGRNLAEVVRDLREETGRGLPPREAAGLARQAAEALDFAHHHDILHRDLKPSNLLLDADRHLWVVDFGLARMQGDSDLTATGDVIGTLRYLSPEQAKGRRGAVDARSDVYALGATLYELLTLRPVFEGDDRAELLIRIASEEPRFSRQLDGAIPLDLRTIVLKALAKDPADRYATAGELAEDLGLFLADQPIRARPPTLAALATRWARRRRKVLAAAGLTAATVLMGLIGAILWSNARLREVNQRLRAEIDRSDRLAREARDQSRLSGRHATGAQIRLAAHAVDAGQSERAQEILGAIRSDDAEALGTFAWRYLWHRARREVVVLAGPTPNFGHMALSPDGNVLATTDPTDGLVLRNARTGSPIRSLAPGSDPLGRPAFSPDGLRVAAVHTTGDPTTPDGVTIWEVATGDLLARLPVARGPDGCRCGFLPGGALLVAVFGLDGVPSQHSTTWDLAGDPGRPRLLTRFDGMPAAGMDWNGGDLLTLESPKQVTLRDPVTAAMVRALPIDAADSGITAAACTAGGETVAAVSGPPWRLTIWEGKTGRRLAGHPTPPDIVRLTISPDGTLAAAVDARQDVHIIDRNIGAIRRIVSERIRHPRLPSVAFAPVGTRLAIALASLPQQSDSPPVSLWDAATGRMLTTFPGRGEEPQRLIFTPDGRSLLISSRSGVRLWRFPDGDPVADRQPAGHDDEAWSVAFSPDGRIVASGSDDSAHDPTLKLWNPASGQLLRSWMGGEGTVSSLCFSPDGRLLASGHLAARGQVRIWEADTGRLRATLEGHTDRVRAVAFSPDGRTLASAGNDGNLRVWNLRSDGSTSACRSLRNRTNLMAIVYSPDSRLIAGADTLGSIAVWDVALSTPLRIIHGDGDELRQLAFAPDGTALAAAGINGTIRLWDPTTGQELFGLAAHRAQVNGLAFSPDGSTLASAAHDGSVRLWRAGP